MPTSHLKSRDMPKAYHSICVNGLPGADLLRLRRWWFLNVIYRASTETDVAVQQLS
jgi:hypothetical protein